MPGGPTLRIGPLKAASRALGWAVNPHGTPDEDALRQAVAGKVVLVTGASFGIGEATARRLGAAGATVVLAARSRDALEHVRDEIVAAGGTAHAHPTDLSDPDAVDAFAAQVLADHGRVDVLVNNAGKSIRRSIELSYDRFHDFQRTIAINYLGPVKLLLALLPSMRGRGAGHIVNVSTLGVRLPPAPRWSAYQASKAAFDVFLRSVAVEIAEDGVTVSTIYMGLVHTRMSAPTGGLRSMPGMTPDEAAGLVCKAIVDRPRVISPWWAGPLEAGFALARRPWEVANGINYRATRDTRAAMSAGRGERSEVSDETLDDVGEIT